MGAYIGIDIDQARINVIAVDDNNEIRGRLKAATPQNQTDVPKLILSMVSKLVDKTKLTSIGIASAGIIDYQKDKISSLEGTSWNDFSIVKSLEQVLEVPVALDGDGNCGVYAEVTIGAAKNYHDVVYLLISDHVSGGIISNGKLHHGFFNSAIGHMTISDDKRQCSCGKSGHLESLVSLPAIADRFGAPASELTEMEPWQEISKELGLAIANLTATLSPEIMILSGSLVNHGSKFFPALSPIVKQLFATYPIPPIITAKYIEEGPAMGAVLLAKNKTQRR